jgi:hypothetical protein
MQRCKVRNSAIPISRWSQAGKQLWYRRLPINSTSRNHFHNEIQTGIQGHRGKSTSCNTFQNEIRTGIKLLTIVILMTVRLISPVMATAAASNTKTQPDSMRSIKKDPPHFEVITDRWRGIQLAPYELNVKGHIYDPYNQNILKGDFPVIGQTIFVVLTASSESLAETFSVPTPSAVSTETAQNQGFFGSEGRIFFAQNIKFSFELYKGNTAFRPRDFELKLTPVFNVNYLNTRENSDVNVNVRQGTNRYDNHIAFQELFVEKHLFDVSDNYDFISMKAGIQQFTSDFRGFLFNEFNFGLRLFGNAAANRIQYNLSYFNMLEKDTNSELNTIFADRNQDVFIFNLYKQDFLTLGYTTQLSFHYNHDKPSIYVDRNGVPVRPAVLGNGQPHDIKAFYLGWSGDGHFGRINIDHAFYQVFGRDSFNSIAGRPIAINAQMAALELSVDKDWMRFRASGFYSSGDANPFDGTGQGFDTIVDLPFFAGGQFSYWNNQKIRLLGVNLTNRRSLIPNLRPSKFEGQANFVNPGLLLFNLGYDAELTPKTKLVLNTNYVRFVNTASLASFLNQGNIDNNIGLDTGIGIIYRPFLNNNAIFTLSLNALTPMAGFTDLYESGSTRASLLMSLILTY